MTETDGKKKYSVPAVETSFKILRLLSTDRFRESTLTEIANAIGANPSTCFRVLHLLEELSVVHYNKRTKRYTLGPYLVILGERAKEFMNYITICKPYLEKVRNRTGLTTVLIQKVNKTRLASIDKIEGSEFSINVSLGRRYGIGEGSFGMCFIAHLDAEKRAELLQHSKIYQSKTDEEKAEYLKELDKVREQGYAITYGDFTPGIFGLAAPIYSEEQDVILAISSFGSIAAFKKEQLVPMAEFIRDTALEVSRKLTGY
jgi:DNA-binding IclR family transcriptional regulator